MISVQRVYDIVRDICNKDQKGFVTPNVFNTLARVAQQNVYNEMFKELQIATSLRMGGRDAGRDKSAYKMVEEDLKDFIRTATIGADADSFTSTAYLDEDGFQVGFIDQNGDLVGVETEFAVVDGYVDDGDGAFTFLEPQDFKHLISMTVVETNTSIEIVRDNEKTARILNSSLSAPTNDFPVAVSSGQKFQVFPSSVGGVVMLYYRQPRSRNPLTGALDAVAFPSYVPIGPSLENNVSLTTAQNVLLMDVTNSRNFDLPEHYMNEVVSEIVKMIGVRLRDNTLAAYGMQQSQAE